MFSFSWGVCAYVTIWAAPLIHFPFLKEMRVKKEIQERRESMAKWDAWGRKVGNMIWLWHFALSLLDLPWKLAAFVTPSSPEIHEMCFLDEFTCHQRVPMRLPVDKTRTHFSSFILRAGGRGTPWEPWGIAVSGNIQETLSFRNTAMFTAVSPLRCRAKHLWLAGLECEGEEKQEQKQLSDPLIYSLFSKSSWQMVGYIWEEQEKRKWEYNTQAIREWFYSQAKTQPRQNTASGLWRVSVCLPSTRTIPCHLLQGSGPRPLILKSSVS